jgi:hypothetical protein
MSEIRKEHTNFKLLNEEKIKETELWLSENVIFLNEKIDRSTLHRLNSSITRFDEKFGPYRSKLPAIAKVLADAEKGLYVVITGNASKKSAGHMLERMSMLYNIFSDFFSRDLTTLLKTPVFRAACSSPEIALNAFEHPEHNHKMVKRCFVAALRPDRKEKDIFDRVYKNIPMPSVNWNEAAKQLMSLSVNELRNLSDIEKVPAVVVADVEPDFIQEQVLRDIEQDPRFQQLQRQIQRMIQFAGQYKIDHIKDAANAMFEEMIDLLGSEQTLWGRIKGTVSSPFKKLLSQAVMAVNTFNIVKNTWDRQKGVFIERQKAIGGEPTPRIVSAIEALFTRAAQRAGQIPSGFTSLFRTEPYPGLEPDTIISQFKIHVAEPELKTAGQPTPARPGGAPTTPAPTLSPAVPPASPAPSTGHPPPPIVNPPAAPPSS